MKGKDLLIYNMNRELINSNTILFNEKNEENFLTNIDAIIYLINLILVYDHNYLYINFNCGLIQGILIGLFVLIINILSFWVYNLLWRPQSDNSYTGIWTKIIGQSTSFIPRILILIGYFYFIIEFMNTLTLDLNLVFNFFGFNLKISNSIFSYLISFLTFLFFGPYVDIYKFKKYTYLSLLSCLWIFGISIYIFFLNFKENGFSKNIQYWNNSIYSLDTFSTFSIDLFMHPFNYLVYIKMFNPTFKRCLKNAIWVQISTFLWLIIMGTIGYLSFPGKNKLLPVYYNYPIYFKLMASIPNFINSFTSNGAIVNILEKELSDLFILGTRNRFESIVPCSVFLFLLGGSLIYWHSTIRFVLKIIGDIINCLLSYIFPFLLFFMYYKFSKPFLCTIIIIICIFSVFLTIILIYIDILGFKKYFQI